MPNGVESPNQRGVVERGHVTFNAARLGDEDDDAESFSARDGTTTGTAGEPTGVVAALKVFMFDDLRHPHDLMADTQRKIVIAWGLPLSLLPIAFLLYMCIEMSLGTGVTAGTVTAAIAMLALALTWIPVNMYVRMKRRLPEALVDVWLASTLVCVLVLAISLVEYPIAITAFFLAALVFLCDTPRKPLLLIGCLVVYLLAAVNHAITGLGRDTTFGAIPNAYWSTAQERFVFQASTLIIGAVVAASLQMQANERSRNALAEVAAARFARRVADQLICFNTDAAIDELRALRVQAYTDDGAYVRTVAPSSRLAAAAGARKPTGKTANAQQQQQQQQQQKGPTLLGEVVSPNASVTSIPENLRFATTVDSIDMSADGSSRQTESMTPTHREATDNGAQSTHHTKTATARVEDDDEAADGEEATTLVSVDHRLIESFELLINHFEMFRPFLPVWLLSTAQHQGDMMAGAHMREATDADMASIDESLNRSESNSASNTPRRSSPRGHHNSSGVYRVDSTRRNGSSSLAPPRSPLAQRLSTHSTGSNDGMSGYRAKAARIAVAWIDFTRAQVPDPQHPALQDALCHFVDAVHEAADNTYGAVHAFVGDSILATWNTGRPCAQVECKAARFMAAVRDATLMHDGLAISATGIAMTGDSFVQLAGASGRQLALTAWFTPWRLALRQLAAFSRIAGGLLLDETTHAAANFTVESRVVDYVTVSKTIGGGFASNRASPTPVPLGPRFSFGYVSSDAPLALHRPSQLSMPPDSASSRTLPVFEVLRDLNNNHTRERKTLAMAASASVLERPEEWMYTLAQSEKESTAAMREALAFAQDGKFSVARDVLEAALRKEAQQRAASHSPISQLSSFGAPSDDTPRQGAGRGKTLFPGALPKNGSGQMRRIPSGQVGAQTPPMAPHPVPPSTLGPTGSGGKDNAGGGGGSGGNARGIHLASSTLPPSTPPLARRLLHKLETFAAMDNASWATFPEDMTKHV